MEKKYESNLLLDVAAYYTEKLAQHGATPQGVDWNAQESQMMRFKQLCKIINKNHLDYSISDIGCGYGALLNFLDERYSSYSYLGIDISEDMIHAARMQHVSNLKARFINSNIPDIVSDYSIASGIFNVRLNHTESEWYDYIQSNLDELYKNCRIGFSFNCLTSYSDKEKKREYLYYADPCQIFNLCKERYSTNIALLHDYGLYEFTILVRKKL